MVRRLEAVSHRLLAWVDALGNRWFGSAANPLYQSGTIVVLLYLVLLVTGLWLTLFYRVGSPWESVARITADPWMGNWVRGLHRFASDAAIVATAVHAARMFVQARNSGPRTLAWISGCVLLALTFLCGWTGYVMVWDTFGEWLAREGARIVDVLPIVSEPISRAFSGESPVPSVFFFLNLFAHIGLPLGMGVVFWLHIKRLNRSAFLPPKTVRWAVVLALTSLAFVQPLDIAPKADPFVRPAAVPVDVFFGFWLPLAEHAGPLAALAVFTAAGGVLLLVPRLAARRGADRPVPSVVDESICVGCVQCSIDCPYGAIEMLPRVHPRSDQVARVDPSLCVSCGICAGSCAPMGVGPPGRTGRDQIAEVHAFMADRCRQPGGIVAIVCAHGAGAAGGHELAATGAAIYPVTCAGNLHTSVIEILLRAGAGGVIVVSCPPRDCRHREGPVWLVERVYHGREAELQERVDRRRIRIVYANAAEGSGAAAAVRRFEREVAALGATTREPEPPRAECQTREETVV
jgi:coenzyme F420-reducing hydrogenase delta subunit/Pyruvate/2-oxoacid:ferredoxin oxidoreductase delta subunit